MRVWVDIDNAPHVQIFRPIISRLRERGASVEVTSRARAFVPELLRDAGIESTVIGRGQTAAGLHKAWALGKRTVSLARFAAGKRFDVAAGHGSRSLPPAARMLGVPNLTMFDYEHVSTWIFRRFCDRVLVPRAILPGANGSARPGVWQAFEGFKEEIYLADFHPDPGIRSRLGVDDGETLAVVRPPSRTAHYHDRRSVAILDIVIERIRSEPRVRVVWLKRGAEDVPPPSARAASVIVPQSPLDGPSLLAAADLAISGGGTMNREAALLGTPAYSVFTGRLGALDRELIRQRRLTLIETIDDANSIPFARKEPGGRMSLNSGLRDFVVGQIEDLARRG